eukprot:gnl/Dysnectes_brevis/3049_a3776_926.p1 GENE.gnl/Dysnectes_brevis/3049_a3776_926~~gnl/Dysnectes_brevis/3049_a3776_926.p1  ORF type:complete len:754 (+),score=148.23 gnl/Dysnectes_brevis/3049_a3776_926:138-2399(+)
MRRRGRQHRARLDQRCPAHPSGTAGRGVRGGVRHSRHGWLRGLQRPLRPPPIQLGQQPGVSVVPSFTPATRRYSLAMGYPLGDGPHSLSVYADNSRILGPLVIPVKEGLSTLIIVLLILLGLGFVGLAAGFIVYVQRRSAFSLSPVELAGLSGSRVDKGKVKKKTDKKKKKWDTSSVPRRSPTVDRKSAAHSTAPSPVSSRPLETPEKHSVEREDTTYRRRGYTSSSVSNTNETRPTRSTTLRGTSRASLSPSPSLSPLTVPGSIAPSLAPSDDHIRSPGGQSARGGRSTSIRSEISMRMRYDPKPIRGSERPVHPPSKSRTVSPRKDAAVYPPLTPSMDPELSTFIPSRSGTVHPNTDIVLDNPPPARSSPRLKMNLNLKLDLPDIPEVPENPAPAITPRVQRVSFGARSRRESEVFTPPPGTAANLDTMEEMPLDHPLQLGGLSPGIPSSCAWPGLDMIESASPIGDGEAIESLPPLSSIKDMTPDSPKSAPGVTTTPMFRRPRISIPPPQITHRPAFQPAPLPHTSIGPQPGFNPSRSAPKDTGHHAHAHALTSRSTDSAGGRATYVPPRSEPPRPVDSGHHVLHGVPGRRRDSLRRTEISLKPMTGSDSHSLTGRALAASQQPRGVKNPTLTRTIKKIEKIGHTYNETRVPPPTDRPTTLLPSKPARSRPVSRTPRRGGRRYVSPDLRGLSPRSPAGVASPRSPVRPSPVRSAGRPSPVPVQPTVDLSRIGTSRQPSPSASDDPFVLEI